MPSQNHTVHKNCLGLSIMSEVTHILNAIEQGDSHAAEQLLPLVYSELRKLAAQKMKQEKPGQTLEPTALVHEAYLRLVGNAEGQMWDSRGHFFAAAAEAMRRILIENARRKQSEKHGGHLDKQPLEEIIFESPMPAERLMALEDALDKLAQIDPIKAKLVQLRYFAGMTLKEIAALLNISHTTADRYWAYARAWLHQEIIRQE